MSTTHTTQDSIAARSNESSRSGSPHTVYVSAATLFNATNVGALTETREGPDFSLPCAAKVIVRLKCDDSATLSITQTDGNASLSVTGELGDWKKTDDPAYWPQVAQGTLPAGSYKVTGTCTNINMAPYNADNRMFLSYEILAEFTDNGGGDTIQPPPICNPCGCCSEDGDENNPPADETPSSAGEECGGSVGAGLVADEAPAARAASVQQTGLRYQSVWRWQAALQDGVLTIRPTSGRSMQFAVLPDSATALPTELTRHHNVRVQLQHADLSPCTTGEPAFWTLVEATGRRVRFDAATGTVAAVVAASGKVTSAADHAAQVQEVFDEAGNMVSCYSPTQGLMLASTGAQGEKLLAWYAPADVSTDAEGRLIPTGEPYKTSIHHTTLVNGVETTTVTRQQAGLPPHTVTRVVEGDSVTVTKGSGAEAIIRTWVTTHPEVGTTQTIETLRRGSAESEPVSCSCTVRKMTAGGWLTQSETEGYGSPLARTTLYNYNEQFRVSRITRPDGGYTEFAYDAEGRVTQELSPWGQDGLQRTRYVYAAQSSRFYDTRPIKVYTDYKAAEGAWLNIKVVDYTYEDSADVERTTATTYAAGVNHQQVTIEERFGESPAYAYAAGKPKFAQDAAGVQTRHEYAPTTLHGAVHLHTVTTMAAGVPVPAHSRKTEEFLAADDTVTFEQESIWDGAAWQLVASTAYEYDAQRRPVKTTRGHGRLSTATWMCCGKLSETDEDGVTTTYGYDSAHQLVESIRAEVQADGVCITPETIVTYTRDAAGRVLETRRDTGAMTTVESVQYDILGREISRTDALGRITTTAYSEDGLTTTVTTPTGATLITTRHTDGSPAAVGGTGQRALVYEYGVQGHLRCDAVKLADDAGTLLSQSLTNGFVQVVQQLQANTSGSGLITHSEYNARGLLVKQWQSSGEEQMAPTLFEYDSFGNLTRQTLALAEEPTPANSSITELAYGVETTDEGVFSCTTQTRYNATGGLLVSVQKQLISQLSPTLAEKVISINERGLTSADWVVYNNSTKRTRYSSVPTSDITAETVVADGFTLSQKDTAGIITTATRAYTAGGMVLVHADGRGNATTTVTDIAGRTLTVTDAAGNVTTTAYDTHHDLPATITDAQGNTSCYRYDERGRKIAEWGTGVQPACFGYDDADNLVSLTTFRGTPATNEDGSPSQSGEGAAAGDVTTWTFDAATGLELCKTYADNSSVVKTYDDFNRLLTETDARGIVKTHSYEPARGLLLSTGNSDDTAARSFAYNHLGQLTQVTDDAGVRTIGYNAFGEQETDSLLADGKTHLVTELRDSYGRSTGFVYSKDGAVQHSVTTGYGADGRIATAGFMHGGSEKQFGYSYLPGSHLLQTLTLPCNMTLTQSYETQRNLLIGMAYHRGNTLVTQRSYSYDTLGRPLTRSTNRSGQTVNDSFVHNSRSELSGAQVNGTTYGYDYDNIGNRNTATEGEEVTAYAANELNQYTTVGDFAPTFDADGNQTLVKTSTGIWSVEYNAENRPVRFTSADGSTLIECRYDTHGRRATKKVTTNGSVTLHQRYIYRGYLQIACCDLTRSNHPCLWLITWDPSQPVATRPLAIQKDAAWYTYGWDLTKNICEIYGQHGYIRTSYTYPPYGEVTATGDVTQPIQWSSEYNDAELALIYYNYRHYNPVDGRWMGRDRVQVNSKENAYTFSFNNAITWWDYIGNNVINVIKRKVLSNSAPDGPEVWRDQINPNGEGDDTRDYKAWLDTRLPKTVDVAITAIKESIEKRIQKLCCTKDTTISNEELTKIEYGINDSVIKKAGDEGYSAYEKYLQIGRFSFYVKDVKIKWDKDSYSWSAIAYAEEQTGTTPPDDPGANKLDYLLSKVPFIGKSRKLIFAEYKIGNTGYCNKKQ